MRRGQNLQHVHVVLAPCEDSNNNGSGSSSAFNTTCRRIVTLLCFAACNR